MKHFINLRRNRKNRHVVCLVLLLAAWLFAGAQSASAMTCYIDAQPEQAEVGQNVTVTVVFSGDNVGRVRATLEYDKSVLSYQGEGGDSGEVSLYMASSGDGIYYSLPFKAVGEGSSSLVMTPLDAYDMDEMEIALPEAQAMSVSVKAPASAAPAPEDTKKEDEKAESGDSSEVKDDSQTQDQANQGTAAETEQKEDQSNRSGATVWVLAGLALLIAVILIAVLVLRARRREDY